MSKMIKLTNEIREDLLKDIKEYLYKTKEVTDTGSFSFTKKLPEVKDKCTLYFREIAFLKMIGLVQHNDKEIAWHGVARRGEDDDYYIEDILSFNQSVTGTTVTTDQEEYCKFMCELSDYEANNLLMHGHSHVNMGVTPSSVDLKHQQDILTGMSDDMFYIFIIWNKKNERTIKIYDFAKNRLYETGDIELKLYDPIGVIDFVNEAAEKLEVVTYTTSYGTWNGSQFTGNAKTDKTNTTNKKDEKNKSDKNTKKDKKNKKDKKKEVSLESYDSNGGYDEFDEFDNPYDYDMYDNLLSYGSYENPIDFSDEHFTGLVKR